LSSATVSESHSTQVTLTIDAKKTGSQSEPLSWTYGVAVKTENLEEVFTLHLTSHSKVQVPSNVYIAEKWIAMLAAAVTCTVKHLNIKNVKNIKLYICQDLSYSRELFLKTQTVLIRTLSKIMNVPPQIINVEFVTRDSARTKRSVAEQYKRAHRAANKKDIDIFISPQEVKTTLSIVHSEWLPDKQKPKNL
jgi:hypothetical protein